VYYRGYAIPVYFKILPDMKGHSSVADRKELLEKFISVFGKAKIAYITADREFDSYEWLNYLTQEQISYVQRLKEKSVCITDSRGRYVRGNHLCHDLPNSSCTNFGQRKLYARHKFSTTITAAKNAQGQLLLMAHSKDIKDPILAYKLRWSIELGFRAMKSGGFNMTQTKVIHPKRITNLYRIIAILTAITHKLGTVLDTIVPIKIKTHLRKAKSPIKLALSCIYSLLSQNYKINSLLLRATKSFLSSSHLDSFFEFCY
jgi:hypothetical protein